MGRVLNEARLKAAKLAELPQAKDRGIVIKAGRIAYKKNRTGTKVR